MTGNSNFASSKEKVYLLFDVGNTQIKIGLANKEKIFGSYTVASTATTSDAFGFLLLDLLTHAAISPAEIGACLACSVVPGYNVLLKEACLRYLHKELLFTPENIPIQIENLYTEPKEVGADRLVAAFASRQLYPDAKSIICIDYGTATTFDCVQNNAYLGGLICPGVYSSATALSLRTAKLPQISLELESLQPDIAKNTVTSLNNGFLFGFVAMSEGLCQRLKTLLEPETIVIGTGGFASSLAVVSNFMDYVKPDLLLEGLRLILPVGLRQKEQLTLKK